VNNNYKNADINQLIQSYINALTNIVSMERAKYAANVSEQTVLNELNNLDKSNGLYVRADDISQEIGQRVLKESVNAHLTKVQSEQIVSTAQAEVTRLEEETKKEFLGKKVQISIKDKKLDVVDQVLIDKSSGQYRVSKFTAKSIKGTIENISYADNLLVIKPAIISRMIVPNRVLVHVYVINLENMTPNILVK
jgi:hypothetical protein